ncbi:hypothetical protein GOQ29_14395 [Clostridium sp. D2Q-14]|uniref:hypothetical protein n=1 Tax=Anaeromonas gelatinilytica TaxID=2683194 RepID=UPI00193AF874|nr:hypothetical protein [Anaeromonas gelatinilytica]MBS4536807.1 hypothetical protein [Anaeromonas gelatinilytica]
MSEILNIKELKEMSTTILEIPNFNNEGTVNIRVKKPNLMVMASQGKIPNTLMSIATKMAGLSTEKRNTNLKELGQTYELYCRAVMVEPTYDEMKDYITDNQMEVIFDWAISEGKKLESFREDEEDGTDNRDVETL